MTELALGDALAPFDFALDLPDGAVVLDAFVIVRYQKPADRTAVVCWMSAAGMGDEVRIGLLSVVIDRLRQHALRKWMRGQDR